MATDDVQVQPASETFIENAKLFTELVLLMEGDPTDGDNERCDTIRERAGELWDSMTPAERHASGAYSSMIQQRREYLAGSVIQCPVFGPDGTAVPMAGVELIAAERRRQVEREGWTADRDDRLYANGDLIKAAESYAQVAFETGILGRVLRRPPEAWPWDEKWWKPSADPVRDLVKAGALLAAEIDRLQRAKSGG